MPFETVGRSDSHAATDGKDTQRACKTYLYRASSFYSDERRH
jgi:hypothetical protein